MKTNISACLNEEEEEDASLIEEELKERIFSCRNDYSFENIGAIEAQLLDKTILTRHSFTARLSFPNYTPPPEVLVV